MDPDELLAIAQDLAQGIRTRGRPRQARLRRAVSATYYAMFHALARCCADMLIGIARPSRSQPAWRQVYRALEHGQAKQSMKKPALRAFPLSIQYFSNYFVTLQEERHRADYDPASTFSRTEALRYIGEAKDAIRQFERVAKSDKRAFAAFVLFKMRS